MKAKEFFRQVRLAESELKVLNEKLRHFEDLGMSMSIGNHSGMPGSHNRGSSRVEIAACGAVDATWDLEKQKREFVAIIAKAERIIRQIPQEKYRKILDYRYICGKSFRWISDELEYNDPRSIYRAHGWALEAAQKILDKEAK